MSNENKLNQDDSAEEKPGIVIDVEAEEIVENSQPKTVEETVSEMATTSSGKSWGFILSVISLVLLIGVAAYSWYQWNNMKADIKMMNQSVLVAAQKQVAMKKALADANSAISAQKERLNTQMAQVDLQEENLIKQQHAFASQESKLVKERLQMEDREQELRAIVVDIRERIGRSGNDWMIAEAEYLIRLGINKLQLGSDLLTAQAAFELADQRLADTADPAWTGTREQLARDIAKLAAFDMPDFTGLNSRLTVLSEQVSDLKMLSADAGSILTKDDDEAVDSAEEKTWDTLGRDLWKGIQNSVRIRKRDEPIQAMIAPEHQYFIYENMKLLLETARLGLLKGDHQVFSDSLIKVDTWLGDLFDQEDSGTLSMKVALSEMVAVKINPQLPDITLSLKVFKSRQSVEVLSTVNIK